MPGSHTVPLSTPGREILDGTAFHRSPLSATSRRCYDPRPLTCLTRDVQRGRVQPPGFSPESEDFALNSLVSPVDRVVFVDGTVQRRGRTQPIFKPRSILASGAPS